MAVIIVLIVSRKSILLVLPYHKDGFFQDEKGVEQYIP